MKHPGVPFSLLVKVGTVFVDGLTYVTRPVRPQRVLRETVSLFFTRWVWYIYDEVLWVCYPSELFNYTFG